MYRKCIAILLPVLAVCSCAEEPASGVEAGTGSGVTFGEVADSEDGRPTTTLTIPDFQVTAYKQGEWGPEMLMSNVVVTRTGLNSWRYSPPVDWPGDQTVDFFAVSPAWVKMENNSWWQHVVRYDGKDTSTDLLVGVKMGATQSDGRLKLNFRHALARVSVSLKCPDGTAPQVSEVRICNVADFGNFTYPHETTSPETNRAELFSCWQVYNTTSTFFPVFKAVDGGYLELSPQSQCVSGGDMFFIPVNLDPVEPGITYRGAYVEVTYRASQSSPYIVARVPLRDSSPDDGRWLPGRSYSYTVTIVPEASRAAESECYAVCVTAD